MNFIESNQKNISSIVKPIDDRKLNELVQEALKIKREDEPSSLYNRFYLSKYPLSDLSENELDLEYFLKQLMAKYKDAIKVKKQGASYQWININSDKMGNIAYRFYLALNPQNMHEVIKRLASVFSGRNIPLKFKYQLKSKMDECDRIIIYSDSQHLKSVQDAIEEVYKFSAYLFEGAERAVSWLYETKTPNVYIAPETPGISFGEKFADVMFQAKLIFCYLYGMTNSNHSIKLKGEDIKKAQDCMKLIISSLLLRNGLLLSKDNRVIMFNDKNIRTMYDFNSGILTNFNEDFRGFTEVTFFPTVEGKNALFENFYNVSEIKPQSGLKIRYLTPDERIKEINMVLYGDYYKYKKQKEDVILKR